MRPELKQLTKKACSAAAAAAAADRAALCFILKTRNGHYTYHPLLNLASAKTQVSCEQIFQLLLLTQMLSGFLTPIGDSQHILGSIWIDQ